MALDEYGQAELTALREMVDRWRGGGDPRWSAALDYARTRSAAVGDQSAVFGCDTRAALSSGRRSRDTQPS